MADHAPPPASPHPGSGLVPKTESPGGARFSRGRRRAVLRTTLALTATIGLVGSTVGASPASAATAATVTVSGTQWGTSTCNLGAVEGNTRFDIDQLRDMGVNAYRIYGGVSRWERADDGGGYGSPTIEQIKDDPAVINWTAWDNVMTNPPGGSDYSWSAPGGIWQGSARTIFQTLKDNGIKPVVTLRDQDNFDGNTWLTSPPSSTADWNEWWEHVFATVYWFNVRNDYRVDDWEIHNEPDYSPQGWRGTQSEYYEFVRRTSDAIQYVYSTYLPGRTARIHAAQTLSGSQWPQGVLSTVGDKFNTINIHNYNGDISGYVRQVHGWMNDAGRGNYPLWLSEWGNLSNQYDTRPEAIRTLTNMIRGSRPGDDHVDGSLIFSMYDWVSTQPNDVFSGVVSASGDESWSYYSFRMGSRALQGCRPTYQSTASASDLTSITTKDAAGALYTLVTNASSSTDYRVDVDLSSLTGGGTTTLWRHDATHADTTDSAPTLSNGRTNVLVPANGAILLKVTDTTAPTGFDDNFEDGDSNGWTVSGGTWQVQQPPGNSKEYVKTSSGDGLSLAGSTTWTNYRVQGYVKLSDEAGGAALVARAQDANRFYQLELTKDPSGTKKWWIWRNNSGTWTPLASGPFTYTANTYNLLRFDVNGSTLTASVSTNFGSSYQSLGSATDSTFGSGRIGVRATGYPASFDEIRVTAL